MKRMVSILLILTFASAAFAATDTPVTYVGGTAKMASGTTGHLDTNSAENLVFEGNGAKLSIPYKAIESQWQDEHLAHRMGVLPLIALALIIPLEKRYFVRITYHDEANVAQIATFEVPRDMQTSLGAVVEARKPKKEYRPVKLPCCNCTASEVKPCAQ